METFWTVQSENLSKALEMYKEVTGKNLSLSDPKMMFEALREIPACRDCIKELLAAHEAGGSQVNGVVNAIFQNIDGYIKIK